MRLLNATTLDQTQEIKNNHKKTFENYKFRKLQKNLSYFFDK